MSKISILAEIQSKVKAPKNQVNKFANYRYRSAEDIIEAVKPVINPMGFYLKLTDEIVEIGNRVYVKSVALISNDDVTYSAEAFAREDEFKKGQDGSQVTGAASSYARKYALNGLFAIDDTKDADATNEHGDEVGNDNREYLNRLIESSTYEERQRVGMRMKINAITTMEDFEKAKQILQDNQLGIEGAVNPSQKEINNHIRKISKA